MPATRRHRAIASTVVVAATLVACGNGAPQDPTRPQASASTSTSIAPSSASSSEASTSPSASVEAVGFTADMDIGGGPDLPTEAFGSLWVLAADGPLMDGSPPQVHRIDPDTNEVVASIELSGRTCQGIGATEDALWACADDELVGIDPTTNEITARVPLDAPQAVSRLAYGDGSIWAFATTAIGPDTVVRVDPATATITGEIPLGTLAGTMAYGHDALWVTAPADDLVLRIDPATNLAEPWAEGIEGPGVVMVGADGIWVSLFGEHNAEAPSAAEATLVKLDLATGSPIVEAATGGALGSDGGFAVTDEAIWVRAPEPFLVVVDPSTGEVTRSVDQAGGGGDVTVAFGSAWLTSHDRGHVWRLDATP